MTACLRSRVCPREDVCVRACVSSRPPRAACRVRSCVNGNVDTDEYDCGFARATSTNRPAAESQHTVEQSPGMDPLSAATTALKAYTVELAAADDFAPQLRSVRRLVVATGECSLGGAICL